MAAQKGPKVLIRPGSVFAWRNLFFPLLALVLLFSVVIGFNLLPKPETKEEKQATPPSSQEDDSGFILYQHPEDTTGRTILYRNRGFFERSFYGGIGEGVREFGVDGTSPYITGLFGKSGWEEAPGGGFYITLEDPFTGDAIGEKMRVFIEKEAVAPNMILAVETVRLPRPFEWLKMVDYDHQFTKEQLEKMVRPGDAVAVELLRDEAGEVVRDESGAPVVAHLIIRRFGGIEQVQKEVGFELPIDED